ncbi:uncharacterized protein LOC123320716 isoform X1 [Coccinella septempunctata]|uniref:uncharacterized protein LOC123320716 isoform X1 n=1 Tax=Coccinella septempunctata TaxID=41139 RepID=UPI001D07AA8C|nr:uncharacterized protein LOC123320716 isoform X1 [Coccinella septempunctata]
MLDISTLWILFFFTSILYRASNQMNIGTVLFVDEDLKRKCWSPASTRLLLTRMIVEDLLPCPSILNMIDDEIVCNLLDYIKLVYHTINKETTGNKRHTILLAFSDALGGYMRHVVLPNVKYSFYAGTLDYSSVEKMQDLYKETKNLLKTNGHGWAEPVCDSCCKCEPHSFSITCPKDCKACESLTLYYGPRFENFDRAIPSPFPDVAVPIPYFDRLIKPTVLAVPLKSYPLRGMQAPWGLNLVVKYYLTGYKCLAKRRSTRAMRMFQNGVYSWMIEEVIPLLGDEEIYTVFGGVLRVLATLKRLGAKRIDLHALRKRYSHMADAYVRRTSIWTFTKHKKIAVAILIFLFIWFMVGFCFICCKLRDRGRKGASEDGGSRKGCKCEGTFKGAIRSVTCGIKKTISTFTGGRSRSRSRSGSRSASPGNKRDCMCFNVKPEVYNVEETEEESYLEDESTQRKIGLDEGGSSNLQRPMCAPSYSFGYDFQTSTSESVTDSDGELEMNSQTPESRSR